jgi:nicotinate phosphoribosyltransferase
MDRKVCSTEFTNHAEKAKGKAKAMLAPSFGSSLTFSEFGTRRRRSFEVQDLVMQGLLEGFQEWKNAGGQGGSLMGTSNVSCNLRSESRCT